MANGWDEACNHYEISEKIYTCIYYYLRKDMYVILYICLRDARFLHFSSLFFFLSEVCISFSFIQAYHNIF